MSGGPTAPVVFQGAGITTSYGVGVHDIPHDLYTADRLNERPSLNSSVLRILLNHSPDHARQRHPRLTTWPEYAWPESDAMKLGTVAHAILLGRGAQYVVFNPSDFMTEKGAPCATLGCKEAQAAIAKARAEGKLDISADRLDQARNAAEVMRSAIIASYPRWSSGVSERTLLFEYRLNSGAHILCRAKPDHLIERCVCAEESSEHVHVFDPKFTGRAWSNVLIDRTIAADGLDIQAAFYVVGAEKTFATVGTETRFTFIVGETYPPYDTRFVALSDTWLSLARQRVDEGANVFGRCLETSVWPGRGRWHVAEVPSWLVASDLIETED